MLVFKVIAQITFCLSACRGNLHTIHHSQNRIEVK
jgi:hypothetical protein